MTSAPATAARLRAGQTGLWGVLLAVVTLAALLGLGAMHVLPIPMSGPRSTSGSISMTGLTASHASGGVVVSAHDVDPARSMPVQRAPTALQRQVVPGPAASQRSSATASAAATGCGVDHAGCLGTLTPSVRAPQLPAEATDTWAAQATRAGPAPPNATEPAPCPRAPSLSELCISRT